MTKRSRYRLIGERAVNQLAEYLRNLGYTVTVENGTWGEPDITYSEFAVEVKHVKYRYRTKRKKKAYRNFGYMKYLKEQWFLLKQYASKNNKIPIVIIVTEKPKFGRLFVLLTEKQIDGWIASKPDTKWVNVDIRNVLLHGRVLWNEQRKN